MSIAAPTELTTFTSQNEMFRGPIQLVQLNPPTARLSARSDARVDTASLTQGAKMIAQASGLAQGQSNAAQAQALTDTADSGLKAIGGVLEQMRSLAVRAANGAVLSTSNRQSLDAQYTQLAEQVQNIARSTRYNDTALTDGSTATLTFQIGSNAQAANQITATLPNATLSSLGIANTDLHNQKDAQNALQSLDLALEQVSQDRQGLDATSQTLQSAQHFAQSQMQTLQQAQQRRTAASPSEPVSSEQAQAVVRSRSARRAQLLYETLLPK